jgi:hypothetical protein
MGDLAPAKLDRIGKAVAKVLETAPDATVVMGTDGRIVRNTQTEKMFEYSGTLARRQGDAPRPDLFCYRHHFLEKPDRQTAGSAR